ncbi:DDE-type integrase/transposase/recombinase [Pseudooceanicola sp. 216_PA32_1]|uniref:DDE-type integrase/transposase/recombinase n=2 Tax=Pseudooceanicola pacificus TaxID=2676438 RepID=A0A844WE21_9RHOB|nr:DDE-type integrase/transposase/recombinase [Pseudooceanicola pacificus]
MGAMQKEGKKKRAGTDLNFKEEPSPRTLLRWFWSYERSGYRAIGLQENYSNSGNRTPRFPPEAMALLTRCVQGYATRRRKTKKRIIEDTQAAFEEMNSRRLAEGMRPWPVPGASTVRRAIGKLDKFYVACQRYGLDATRKKFAVFENGVSSLYPAERIEIDECEIDVMTLATNSFIWHLLSEEERKRVPRGRRWMYVAICATTRCILALHICKATSAAEAVKCLALVTRDKSDLARAAGAQCSWHQHAGLSAVVTDQGSAFIAFIFAQTVAALGGDHDAPAAATPWLRAFIERVFGTFNTDLFQEANGRTFSNPFERGDFDSKGSATLTDDQLAKMLIRYVVDVYHNRPHEGLQGEAPSDAWERLGTKYPIVPPPLPAERRAIFGLRTRRNVRGNGVVVCGVSYNSPQLQNHFIHGPDNEQHVQVRVNPEDMGAIDVLLGQEWVRCLPNGGGFEGIRLELWINKVREIRQRNHDLAQMKRHIVRAALEDIRAMNEEPWRLLSVTPFALSAKQINQVERSVFMGLELEPLADDPARSELTATTFQVTGRSESGELENGTDATVGLTAVTVCDDEIIPENDLVFRGRGDG